MARRRASGCAIPRREAGTGDEHGPRRTGGGRGIRGSCSGSSAAIVIVLDQATKAWVEASFALAAPSAPVGSPSARRRSSVTSCASPGPGTTAGSSACSVTPRPSSASPASRSSRSSCGSRRRQGVQSPLLTVGARPAARWRHRQPHRPAPVRARHRLGGHGHRQPPLLHLQRRRCRDHHRGRAAHRDEPARAAPGPPGRRAPTRPGRPGHERRAPVNAVLRVQVPAAGRRRPCRPLRGRRLGALPVPCPAAHHRRPGDQRRRAPSRPATRSRRVRSSSWTCRTRRPRTLAPEPMDLLGRLPGRRPAHRGQALGPGHPSRHPATHGDARQCAPGHGAEDEGTALGTIGRRRPGGHRPSARPRHQRPADGRPDRCRPAGAPGTAQGAPRPQALPRARRGHGGRAGGTHRGAHRARPARPAAHGRSCRTGASPSRCTASGSGSRRGPCWRWTWSPDARTRSACISRPSATPSRATRCTRRARRAAVRTASVGCSCTRGGWSSRRRRVTGSSAPRRRCRRSSRPCSTGCGPSGWTLA